MSWKRDNHMLLVIIIYRFSKERISKDLIISFDKT